MTSIRKNPQITIWDTFMHFKCKAIANGEKSRFL